MRVWACRVCGPRVCGRVWACVCVHSVCECVGNKKTHAMFVNSQPQRGRAHGTGSAQREIPPPLTPRRELGLGPLQHKDEREERAVSSETWSSHARSESR